MKNKILTILGVILMIIILAIGLFIFYQPARYIMVDFIKTTISTVSRYSHRFKDGGKVCTDSSQCISNKCIYDEFETFGDITNCHHNDIQLLPEDTDIRGKCQKYPLDIFSWKCIRILKDRVITYECGCAIQ